jgi:hypothetical protein
MMNTRIPSVLDTYFQHKLLTKVVGRPTYESLQLLSTEIKANASSVPSTLGGGLYGHLGLILSDERYATLANSVPWITPPNPGPFVPPNPATAAQLEAAKDVWREHKLTFELCQATEKALIAQIVDSIDSIYLRALLNRVTGQYSNSIRAVLAHLFTTHGKITPQQVKATEMAVYSMNYSIILPVDTVFNSIDDLADLAGHANSPLTPQQMIDLAFVILAKEPILQQDLRLWNRRPIPERTWANMIDHFREAQTDLSSLPTAGGVYHQQPPHHANSAVTIADLVTQRLLDAYPPTTEENIATASTNDVATAHEVANAAVLQREASIASREAALLSQMQEMMSTFWAGNNNRNNRSGNRGNRNNNSNHQGRTNDRNPTGGRGRTQSPRSYCWTHGACAHSSAQCNTQTTGHQSTATFANMQGGSTNNCFWLPA